MALRWRGADVALASRWRRGAHWLTIAAGNPPGALDRWTMALIELITVLALLQFLYFGILVGNARERYSVKAPATTGNQLFERYLRVQMNTLELLILFLPGNHPKFHDRFVDHVGIG